MYDKYTKEEKTAYYTRETGRLMGVLREAYMDFFRLESLNEFLDVAKKADNLSFSNQLILWKEKINFTQFDTYKRWQQIGRQPRGGSKTLMLLKGNSQTPKILYVLDKSLTEGEETAGKPNITVYKENVLKYMKNYPSNGNSINEDIYKDFDIIKAYKEGLGQNIEEKMLNRMENIVKSTALTNNEFYHRNKPRQIQKEEFLNVTKKKGNVLEPSMGIGGFLGNIPSEMQGIKFYGVEQDSISGRIAGLLYPESSIQIKGFEETTFTNNFFDVSIGNVPFGDFKLNDRDYDRNNFLIHDYFFAKSIDKVRNSGIIAFITSSGTGKMYL